MKTIKSIWGKGAGEITRIQDIPIVTRSVVERIIERCQKDIERADAGEISEERGREAEIIKFFAEAELIQFEERQGWEEPAERHERKK